MWYLSWIKTRLNWGIAQNHIGLYIPPPVVAQHKDELKDYETAAATVRFSLDKKLPITLIQKLVKARMKKNDEAKLST